MKIAVLGMGYLGVTHAACMASLGHEVLGVDIDDEKLAKLSSGEVPFFEPGLDALTEQMVRAGRLRFSSSYRDAADFADVHFIAVGTPQKRGEFAADVSAIDSVIEELAPMLTRAVVLFGKSTAPVGTAERLRVRAQELAPAGADVELAWNPEFLREGHAIKDTLEPDRLVLGAARDGAGRAIAVAKEVYSSILEKGIPFLTVDLATAELVKISANAFLATKISFINAIAEVCEAAGADVVQLADALGYDQRIGRAFLNAGLGFGGGCLPKDIRAFMARAGELGADQALTFLREVDAINMRRRSQMVELTREVCGSLLGVRVAVLGAAFKPDSDDVRDSPALNVAGQLQLQGAAVNVYDPKATDNCRKIFPTLGYSASVVDACDRADIVLVLTEWQEFRDIEPSELASIVAHKRILDGRNCLDPQQWRASGWLYRGFGRGRSESSNGF
ncbi:UDP-glucose 6-dehydrogenase [Mycolicibacterium vanbaalenii]|uniref:UDP-glucose 6-dehydrogenase n=1 Tax=Mycolicibacterium vanbaalenii TaxID=110539 RepID=A0A5S9R4X6_MYCVN|nr:UDP-glucose/GDP-mannose dehydrogenase family protein [Mycolicibacterium vanbaalenii]CAA0128235.1 UDP-glucose 6-dehydrogenase [Mycolicibacterium vanbaalenii]